MILPDQQGRSASWISFKAQSKDKNKDRFWWISKVRLRVGFLSNLFQDRPRPSHCRVIAAMRMADCKALRQQKQETFAPCSSIWHNHLLVTLSLHPGHFAMYLGKDALWCCHVSGLNMLCTGILFNFINFGDLTIGIGHQLKMVRADIIFVATGGRVNFLLTA